MNGDDRRRSRRWNETKPFRATAPAWLPAFQAPANLLQHERTRTYECTQADTYTNTTLVHRAGPRNEREEDIEVEVAKARRGNADE